MRGRGCSKTPEWVVEIINEAIKKHGQNAAARAIGLPLFSVQKMKRGVGEPTMATLQKIVDYTGQPVVIELLPSR